MESKQYTIAGISCMSCVSKIEKSLYGNSAIKKISIDKETGTTTLEGESLPHYDIISSLVSAAGEYSLSATSASQSASKESNRSYKPLLIIVLYLLGTTLLLEFSNGMFQMKTWMAHFMAGFFLVFSFFKMLDIAAFAKAYQSYDIIAAKAKWYGYVFPFIELGLGIAYLLYSDNELTHLITAIVMFVSLIGVIKSVVQKTEIQCACLGTVFNLPMSYITIIEDGIMLVMALLMYFY
ncbi:cation transporter [Bacteroidia bacterium]|nr:cation transporter [Bacteroidia bacterium]MDC1431274.1 cation transporter [Bacteroidia bacterium]|tara:strand:+ start:1076 stop:1786 length:711 start_codon:yes stop_codon:yes gene_type:complete